MKLQRQTPEAREGENPLAALGISSAEELLYRAMLRAPGSTAQALAHLLNVGKRVIERRAAALENKGFATYAPERVRRWFPCPPDIAVETLLLQRQKDILVARQAVADLQQEQQNGDERDPLVEIIEADPAAMKRPYASSHDRAVVEVLCLVRPPFVVSSPGNDESARAAARARGVRYRNIVHPDVLGLPGWLERLKQAIDAGEEVRLLEDFPFKMIVADRDLGLMPLKIADPKGPMLLLRRSAVLDALCELFEILWLRAVPFRFGAEGEPLVGSTIETDQLQRVVTFMAAGANDKQLAARMGVSERTLTRRIDLIYQELGAKTRFQAGWLAALRTMKAASVAVRGQDPQPPRLD